MRTGLSAISVGCRVSLKRRITLSFIGESCRGLSPLSLRMSTIGGILFYCLQGTAATPVTFPTLSSRLELTATSSTGLQAQFEFRTHDQDGLLVYHPLLQDGSAGLTVSIDRDKLSACRLCVLHRSADNHSPTCQMRVEFGIGE
jgi:hypothetical protein